MSKQPVATEEESSSVAKGVHLFLPSESSPSIYGVPLQLPVMMLLLLVETFGGRGEKNLSELSIILQHFHFPV